MAEVRPLDPDQAEDDATLDGAVPEALRDRLRFLWRTARLLMHVLFGLLLALIVHLDFSHRLSPEKLAGLWSRGLLRILGIRWRVRGHAPITHGVIVANHVSWLDIPLIVASMPTRFVSKSEVRHWPVAGWLADAAGTFYLRRGQGGSRLLLNRLIPFLRQGGNVAFFPEGTTSSGPETLPFHPRLFAAAVEAACPLQPISVRYSRASNGANIAPFVGDDDLVSHLLRLLRNRELDAELILGQVLDPSGQTREHLSEQTRTCIESQLKPPFVAA